MMKHASIERGLRAAGLSLLIYLSPLGPGTAAHGAEQAPGVFQDLLEPGPYRVAHQDLKLVDTTRSTPAFKSYPGSDSRHLKTRVYYPAAPRALEPLRPGPPPIKSEGGPYPLIMYSHGFMSFRSEGAYLAEHLASHGYIIIAPNFPATNFRAPGDPNLADVVSQPGDISFLIDWALSASEGSDHPLDGQADPTQIAAMGLSLGGLTTTLVTFHPSLRDDRIQLAVAMAPPTFMFTPSFFEGVETPYMVIGGDIDAIVPYDINLAPLVETAPQAWLSTLKGASHTGFTNIAAGPLRVYSNPDTLGCSQVSKNIPEDRDFIASLEAEGAGIEAKEIPPPCPDPTLPDAMKAKAQHQLTTALIFAFLIQEDFGPSNGVDLPAPLSDLSAEVPSLDVRAPRSLTSSTSSEAY